MTNTEQAVGTTAVDASTQTVEASNGVAYAYRRFGTSSDGVPVVFLQHFRGNLDNWDPALVDGIASEREVILVDNAGVGASTGRVPSTVAEMARDALAFTDALGLRSFDLFGFSLGGFVAQELALLRPWAVRNLVLAGTGPKGAPAMHGWREDIERESRHDVPTPANLLYIFFAHSDSSRALGVEFLQRISARTEGRDAPTTPAVRDAQYDAVLEWGIPSIAALERLTAIRQPTLVLQGDDDLMIRTPGSHTLAGLIPSARLHIFPDAAHASIFQYPQQAAALVREFLSTAKA
ncbi:alpha/beta fold hydrolase [Curtobacterium flaccumfaciens]|jgi:pimeloyl-ACP methyl ester carboxylesterase|uniref:alpha/beta fold hydrolase n=1 Tax=Curtobacterium flaccumfaciens TaxID=2035 RepID=UPI001BE0DF5E|nr:alpha/beta hydrolase [Curtobacterium flaccumfaciens]MBT1583809.1 alpha/beta hydrolase [Curtobacterium flaccumfaciens pv. flaccumfaciens]MCX2798555.1 alpha/beta hydrolase [Curtobacterium flaccumfaciens pv. flaccumfaciens]